jgi:hypothetical protein
VLPFYNFVDLSAPSNRRLSLAITYYEIPAIVLYDFTFMYLFGRAVFDKTRGQSRQMLLLIVKSFIHAFSRWVGALCGSPYIGSLSYTRSRGGCLMLCVFLGDIRDPSIFQVMSDALCDLWNTPDRAPILGVICDVT